MLISRMNETAIFETPTTQPGWTAMFPAPQNLHGRAKQAVLGLMAVLVLLLTAGPAFGVRASGPQAFFTYQQAVGSGFGGPVGVAVDSAGDVFVADCGWSCAIYEIVAVNGAVSANSTVIQIASKFSFGMPFDVKLDASGNLFVADWVYGNVYKIAAVNGVVSATSAVTTIESGFSGPTSLAFDASGNLFVVDNGSKNVYEIPATSGSIVAGTTPVVTAYPSGGSWLGPYGVATDASGDVFVTDSDGSVGNVYEIVAVNGVVSSSSAVNPVGSGFTAPTGVVVDGQSPIRAVRPCI